MVKGGELRLVEQVASCHVIIDDRCRTRGSLTSSMKGHQQVILPAGVRIQYGVVHRGVATSPNQRHCNDNTHCYFFLFVNLDTV